YISTPDGGKYVFKAWIEDSSGNVLLASRPVETILEWGIRPTDAPPADLTKGQEVDLPVEWEELYEYLPWQTTPLERNEAFPGRVAIFRSRKTEDQYPGHFAKVNAVADWLESMGYEPGNPLDISFDNVIVKLADAGSAAEAVFFDDGVESGTNGWSASGLWHITDSRYVSASHSWAYNDGVDYDTGAANAGALETPWISLSDGYSAILRFRSWYQTEDEGVTWDRKLVYVTTNGTQWTLVKQISGPSQQWCSYSVDLTAYAGQTVKIRFYFETRDALYNNYPGWFVDDVSVKGRPVTTMVVWSDDMDSGTNGWSADGLWHLSNSRYVSASHAWCYNDGQDYDTGARNSGSLITPWIDLQGLSQASLRFRSWYETEDEGTAWDRKRVFVTTDGTNWTQVYQVSGQSEQWLALHVDLSSYAGHMIRVKFFFDTVDGLHNGYEGWYVDDVEITSVSEGTGGTVLDESVESGTNGWIASGLWHVSESRANSPTHSWCYNNGTNYDTGSANSGDLISPWVDLSGTENATLRFRSWYRTEDSGTSWDRKLVFVTTDGTNWQQVAQVSGQMSAWVTYSVDLSPYVGQRIRIRFCFDTVDHLYNAYEGWYVDDIRVMVSGSGVLFADDFNDGDMDGWQRIAGCGNWTVEDGSLRAWRLGNSDNILVAGDGTWSNYEVSADIRYNAQGPYFNDAELYLRYVDRENFVKVHIRNFHGFWRLKYTVRENTNITSQGWIHEFTKTNRPVENTWYNLKVVATGQIFHVYFDGDYVGTFVVSNLLTGKIGVGGMAQQLGISEPWKGYYFVDDDEYSFWAPEGQAQVSGHPLNLDWGYLDRFFTTLILPGTYVMSDTEVSNVVTWMNRGLRSILATDGGVAMKDETGADDRGRIEELFGVASGSFISDNTFHVIRVLDGTHYVTHDSRTGTAININAPSHLWTEPDGARVLGTAERLSPPVIVGAPSLLANVYGDDPQCPKKTFCFNFSVDTGDMLTDEFSLIAQRAFEWLRGEAFKVRVELKYPHPSGDPSLDLTLLSTEAWLMGETG
ncbi:MAG: hypothetical protein DRO01_06300, partial [Thermoproteota archaeon]